VPQPKSALFVGDSFTAGYGVEQRSSRNGYPFLICPVAGWGCSVDAEGGSGYLRDGTQSSPDHQKAIDRLDADKARYLVDILIADLGRNDLGPYSVPEIIEAARQFFTKARSFWPAATMVAVIPSFVTPVPYDGYEELKSGFDSIADDFHVQLIDPIKEGWYRDVDTDSMVIVSDHTHPNPYGNFFISQRLEDSLTALGLTGTKSVS
jgi:lysophospholipase L1-like esterase